MKYYTVDNLIKNPWDQVMAAVWQRYPNPYSRHVLSEDTIQRRVEGPLLFTKRLLIKTNPIPKWGQRFVHVRQVVIVEESVLDRDSKKLITYTRNVGMATTISAVEKCVYEPSISEKDDNVTLLKREAWIDSQLRGFSAVLERFGIERYRLNAYNALKGLNYVLEHLFPSPPPKFAVSQSNSNTKCDAIPRQMESSHAKVSIWSWPPLYIRYA